MKRWVCPRGLEHTGKDVEISDIWKLGRFDESGRCSLEPRRPVIQETRREQCIDDEVQVEKHTRCRPDVEVVKAKLETFDERKREMNR